MLKKNRKTSRSLRYYLIMAGILVSVLLASRLLIPSRVIVNVCLFNMVTGLPCMTCGMTRAFHSISMGNFKEAINYHPLSIFTYILAVFHFFVAVAGICGLEINIYKIHRIFPYIVLGIFFIFWMLRLFTGIFNL